MISQAVWTEVVIKLATYDKKVAYMEGGVKNYLDRKIEEHDK